MGCVYSEVFVCYHHKSGALYLVVDTLSRRATLLVIMSNEVVGLDYLKDMYADDAEYKEI